MKPLKRFIILALPRTGSTNLVLFLKQVPGLVCKNEILHKARRDNPFRSAERLFCRSEGLIGFKVMPWHLPEKESPAWLSKLGETSQFRMIVLTRKSTSEQAISLALAEVTRCYIPKGRRVRSSPHIILPLHRIENALNKIYALEALVSRLAGTIPAEKVLFTQYEDVIQRRGKELVLDFLGIDYCDIDFSNVLKRMGGANAWKRLLVNYQEIESAFLREPLDSPPAPATSECAAYESN